MTIEIIAICCILYTTVRIGKGIAYLIAVSILGRDEVNRLST